MMKIDILSLFPEMFDGFLKTSIIKRAIDSQVVDVHIHNFREFADNKHKKVDDYPYGGGQGMVLMCQPIIDCLKTLTTPDSLVILMSPQGQTFHQQLSYQLSLETKEELISKIPKTVTVGNIKSAVQKLGMDKDDGDGGSINYYFLHDSYNKADIFIEVSDIYYDTGNSNTTDIKIRFQNADKRFEYGAYLILSNYLK